MRGERVIQDRIPVDFQAGHRALTFETRMTIGVTDQYLLGRTGCRDVQQYLSTMVLRQLME